MTRGRNILLVLLAAAAFVPADWAGLWLIQRSVCAFDACKPMTFSAFWWIPVLQIVVLVLATLLDFQASNRATHQASTTTIPEADA